MIQLTHYNSKFKTEKFPITLICDNVTNAANVGSLFRIADAFGVEKLIFCGENISVGRKSSKTSRATEKYVNYSIETDIVKTITDLKTNNTNIIAVEITKDSIALSDFEFKSQPIILILGNENYGISDSVLKLCNTILHVNMFGHNSSMNVSQAASVSLYEITKQLQKL